MVRRKNVIATITQSVGVAAVSTLCWFAIGYSLAFGVGQPMLGFDGDTVQSIIGSTQAAFLNGVTMTSAHSLAPGLPEYLWVAYQLTFAIITPALVTGAFAERLKYSGLLLFTVLWSIFVYAPIAHWVWGGGFLGSAGVLDFAGGAVVHVNSGVAGLVCALFLGPRKGYGTEAMNAHNPVLTMIGASLLLVGWIGFNAGSAWAADSIASVALLNTIVAAMAAAAVVIQILREESRSICSRSIAACSRTVASRNSCARTGCRACPMPPRCGSPGLPHSDSAVQANGEGPCREPASSIASHRSTARKRSPGD
jgi:Amt family ammonium transporter